MKHFRKSRYYETVYPRIYAYFSSHEKALRILKIAYRGLPLLIAGAYAGILVCSFIDRPRVFFLKELLIPAALFVTVSLLRKIVDFKRPYSVYPIKSLVSKQKTGESFPSRHSASAVIIAAAGCFFSVPLGIILFIAALLVSATRLLSGVHFPLDVAAGWAFGLGFGLLFFL
ncbi:MAG: phosphatase PAP2 family protein [Lachnospiraceae bacterium]|jgi:phosphatidylglycerophosphatase B